MKTPIASLSPRLVAPVAAAFWGLPWVATAAPRPQTPVQAQTDATVAPTAPPGVQRPIAPDAAAPPTPATPPAPAPAPVTEGAVSEVPDPASSGDPGPTPVPDNPELGQKPAVETSEIAPSPPLRENVAKDLLVADEPAAPPRPPTALATPEEDDDDARDLAIARGYDERFRPRTNPGRFALGARAMFANAGGKNQVGGRLGGAQVDAGQSWNWVGYAVTLSAWGGRIVLPERTGAEMNALVGIGPTANLGRLALLGRGYLDLRVGYDFFYGVVNRRRDTAIVVEDENGVTLTQSQNLLPHGPRIQLNMGLLSSDVTRRFFHGFGVTAGYQALVGSFRGDLPFTHMLTLGLSYSLN